MRDQTAREPKFPATCARCGGRISEPVAFCPHCGAHARFALSGDASPHARRGATAGAAATGAAAAAPRVEPAVESYDFEGDLDPPWPGRPTPLFASPDGDPYGEVRRPGFRNTRQWGIKGGTGLILVAFVVLYGGAVLLHRHDDTTPATQQSDSKSVEGSIAGVSNSHSNLHSNVAAPSANSAPLANDEPPMSLFSDSPSKNPPPAMQRNNSSANNVAPAAPQSNDASANNLPPAPPPTAAAGNGTPPAPQLSEPAQPNPPVASLPPPGAAVNPAPALPSAPAASVSNGVVQQQAQPGGANDRYAKSHERTRMHGRTNDVRADVRAYSYSGRATAEPQSQPRNARMTAHASFARAFDSAQARLAKNDLRGARASISSALAAEPGSGEALSLQQDLSSREQARDASLSAARACVVQSRWNCVWHNAGKALSIDASSTEAKALVDRAIVESGAATSPPGPGPDNVQVPMLQ